MEDETLTAPLRPRLRAVEAHEVKQQGERMVAVRDPAWPPDRIVLLSHAAVALISLFDGERDLRELQAAFMKRHGELVPAEIIETVIAQLDRALLLDSPRYARDLEERRSAFRAQSVRPMTMAGSCFPPDAEGTRALLDGYYTLPDGPGRLPDVADARTGGPLLGLIVPHIDYQRGDALYAQGYLEIAEDAPEAELYVLLGTDHKGEVDEPFSLTGLDYETPFGRLRTDLELVGDLVTADPSLGDGELAHAAEHSLEFQAVMLHHALGERADAVRVLPVLCGLLTDREGRETPERAAKVEAFIERLRTLRETRRVCFIAGADLAHLGPAFGTPPLHETAHESLERRDRKTLDLLAAGDAEGFRRDVTQDGNRRQICGLSAIYTLLSVIGASAGTVLGYRQCPVPGDEEGGSRVSIATVSYP